MTTIAYNHKDKQISVDSRASNNEFIETDEYIKFKESEGVMFFICGNPDEIDLMIKAYFTGEVDSLISNSQSTILVSDGDNVYLCSCDKADIWKQQAKHSTSIGNGMRFAVSALDFGKSSKEAVEYAITRDFYSGGKVHTYDIKLGKFI